MQALTNKKKRHTNRNQPLDVFFSPKNVAVLGATENPGSVGRTLLWNIMTSPFGGTVYPVNPKRSSVLGMKAYPSVSAIPEEIDLAVIVTPPPSIPGLIKECGENGVRGGGGARVARRRANHRRRFLLRRGGHAWDGNSRRGCRLHESR